ncbi:MAG: hypothetical protein ACREEP_12510 [Dongiaceae bacterium]
MTNRVKLWLGVSAMALLSGALPAAPALTSAATEIFGVGLTSDAWAQESSGESGEGAETECATTEDGEGDEGGTTECPTDDATSGEDGEGG